MNTVYFKVLAPAAPDVGNQARVQYNISSAERWTDRESQSDSGGHVESYQASLKMAPFEALYGRRCRTPLMWDEVGDRQLFGPDLIRESEEKVKLIQDRVKVAQSRQKSYADSKCKEVVYEIGDRAYLRVSPLRGVKRFGVKGKLAPRFVRPYRVLDRMEKWPTSWSYPKDYQEFMMCFTFPS